MIGPLFSVYDSHTTDIHTLHSLLYIYLLPMASLTVEQVRRMVDITVGSIGSPILSDMIDLKMRCVSKGFCEDFDLRNNVPARIQKRADHLKESTGWDARRIAAKAADVRKEVLKGKLPRAVSAHFDLAVDVASKATKKQFWKLERDFPEWGSAFGAEFDF